MSTYQDIELKSLPSLMKGYLKAAGLLIKKSLVVAHGGSKIPTLPNVRLVLKAYRLDPQQVKEYTHNTGLPISTYLPLAYLYSVAFPMVIELFTRKDFPYPPAGLVHIHNEIIRHKRTRTDAIVDIYVHCRHLREHRAGMLIDVVSEVYCGGELVFEQVSTMLHKQKTSLSDTPKDDSKNNAFEKTENYHKEEVNASVTTIRQYARISGDRNPIHISRFTAKLFGYPQIIAHGSWMMARILSSTEKELAEACCYEVDFGKPFLVPGKATLFVCQQNQDNWVYSLEKAEQQKVILRARVAPLADAGHKSY